MDGIRDAELGMSLRDKVVRRVRSDIVSGRSAPGTMYSVPSLAEQLGVSTTPVREALLELSRGGLITPLRNRGFRVETTSLEELNNLFALRELLERYAMVTLAERRISDAGELKALADDIAAAVKNKDILGYLEADRAFHQALIAKVENPLAHTTDHGLAGRNAIIRHRTRPLVACAKRRRLMSTTSSSISSSLGTSKRSPVSSAITFSDWKPVFTAALSDRLGSDPK